MWPWWQSAARTAASPKVTPKRPFHYWIIRGSTETALRNWPTGASRTRHPATTSFHVHLPPLALLHQPFPHVTTIWGGLAGGASSAKSIPAIRFGRSEKRAHLNCWSTAKDPRSRSRSRSNQLAHGNSSSTLLRLPHFSTHSRLPNRSFTAPCWFYGGFFNAYPPFLSAALPVEDTWPEEAAGI